MTDDAGAPTSVRIDYLLPAPAADVFKAWTDPASMAEWLSPSGRAEVEADVRVGGSFRVVMLDDGMRLEHEGEYLVIEPPLRLVFTWRSPYTGSAPSVVTVLLSPRGGQTELTLMHERLPAEHRESHRSGWGSILDNLFMSLERVGNVPRPPGSSEERDA